MKKAIGFVVNAAILAAAHLISFSAYERPTTISRPSELDRQDCRIGVLSGYASEIGESDVTLPFATSEACAQYLGVTRTALSLVINRLVARGEIVHPGHSRFVIRGIV